MFQQDSNSHRRSIRRARLPLDHHHHFYEFHLFLWSSLLGSVRVSLSADGPSHSSEKLRFGRSPFLHQIAAACSGPSQAFDSQQRTSGWGFWPLCSANIRAKVNRLIYLEGGTKFTKILLRPGSRIVFANWKWHPNYFDWNGGFVNVAMAV